MATFVMRKGEIVPIEEAEPLVTTYGVGPAIISDSMPPTRHMCDGNYYTSKAQFREVTRAHGCVEVGTDQSILKPRKPVLLDKNKRVQDIKRAIDILKQRDSKRRRRRK